MKTKECNKKVKNMFPEFRELIHRLREENPRFAHLFERHEELDQEICLLEQDPAQPRYLQTVWGLGYVFVPDGENA